DEGERTAVVRPFGGPGAAVAPRELAAVAAVSVRGHEAAIELEGEPTARREARPPAGRHAPQRAAGGGHGVDRPLVVARPVVADVPVAVEDDRRAVGRPAREPVGVNVLLGAVGQPRAAAAAGVDHDYV